MIGLSRVLALLALLPPLGAAAGQQPNEQGPASATTLGTGQPPIDGTVLNLGEVEQRLTVPVVVGSTGPYNFIIDTGAERTVVSRQLAGTLQLGPGKPVTLISMTGTRQVSTVIVPQLSIQSIGDQHTIEAPALEQANLGAAGLLGIDTLSLHQVAIDFETGQMRVSRSEKKNRERPRQNEDEIVVTGKSLFGQLIVTDAWYGSTRIRVVIDTGAQISMGNSALFQKLHLRRDEVNKIVITGVTGEKMPADYLQVGQIQIGGVTFNNLPVAFADVAPFAHFGLTDRPALLLGMDGLKFFRHVEIDFPNRQIRFMLPKDKNRSHLGSIIPGVNSASPGSSVGLH